MPNIPNVKNANRHAPFSACLTLCKYKLRKRPNIICNIKVNKQAHSLDIFYDSIIQDFLFTMEFQSAGLLVCTMLPDNCVGSFYFMVCF